MATELKAFSGIMDTDNSEYVVAPTFHTYAKNIVFRGNQNNLRPQNILGTRQISYALPTGTTIRCIGSFYDAKKQRIFFFLYSDATNNGIYILDTNTQTVTPLIVSNTSTSGDILGFTLTKTVYNINVIYGDDLQGDSLYWLDSLKRPSYINIDQQLDGDYGTVERSFIDVIKPPFNAPPYGAYEDDATVNVNNLRRNLFVAKTRAVYNDNTKSVWSSHSPMPLPANYNDAEIDTDATKNCRIAWVIQTGDLTVKRIEVAIAENLGMLMSDFYLVKIFDKAQDSIADNDTIIFRFYNDQAYTYIDVSDSVQEFDWIPQEADSQELLNGNSLIYGNIKEGYDLPVLTAIATGVNDELPLIDYYNVLFNVTQQGESGFETENIHVIVLGDVHVGNIFTIITTGETITFTATVATTDNVIDGLSAAAVVAGFTVISSDTENLVITKANESLQLYYSDVHGSEDENFVYDWFSRYGFGVVYFDTKGRTNGVVYTNDLTIQTPDYFENLSFNREFAWVSISISSRPPIWASYYQLVRTKNLSKSTFIYWVTSQTFKDDKYAYLSIESLNQYIKDNPSASFLAYDFSPNDRIKLIKLYPSGGFTTPIVYPGPTVSESKDFAIVTSVINPIINGAQETGQFIKIALPTTDVNFNFGIQSFLDIPYDYSHYFIQLYTPAKAVANGLDLFYEFGERYAIGNAGTVSAFHQGMLQNQTPDLGTPATFRLVKGDDYVRLLDINAGVELKYTMLEEDISDADFIPMTLEKTFQNAGWVAQSVAAQQLVIDIEDSNNWMINITDGNAHTFNIKGSATIKATNTNSDTYKWRIYVVDPSGTQHDTDLFEIDGVTADRTYVFNFNLPIVVDAGFTKMLLLGDSESSHDAVCHIISGSLTITEASDVFPEYIISPHFSNFFQSAVNSNGRAWVHDSNARQATYGNLHRWGLNKEPNTNINRTNRFYGLDFIESDLSKGDILRYKTRGQELRMFFTRGVGRTGIYAKYIQNNSGNNQLVTTDDILTANNIDYYLGEHGLGTQPTGLVSSASSDYFIDPVTGDQIRIAPNGMESVSNLYWGKYYMRSLFTPYNKTWDRTDGSLAKIMGCYNFLESQCIMLLQGGTNGSDTILDYAFSFNEQRNGYDTFYDFHPEMITCAETQIYSWLNGNLYIHDNSDAYNNFYDTQYNSSIKLVFNKDVAVKKKYGAIGYQSNQIWISDTNGDIYTSFFNPQTGLQQISQLKEVDYILEEGIRTAPFNYDANSGADAELAVLEGDLLEGNWMSANLIYVGSDFSFIYTPYISWVVSPKNF